MKYLLDTSWAIHYLRGGERVVKKLAALRKEGLATSIITLAELYESVRKLGRPIGDLDLLIASTCLCYDLTLLTDNTGEFERVENLKM